MNKKFKLFLSKEEFIVFSKAMGFYDRKLEHDIKLTNNEAEIHKISDMDCNRLKRKMGDCINVVLNAAGMNFKKLLKASLSVIQVYIIDIDLQASAKKWDGVRFKFKEPYLRGDFWCPNV